MKSIALIFLCVLCASCDSIVLKSAGEPKSVQAEEAWKAPPYEWDESLLSISGTRDEKYYRVLDPEVRGKNLPKVSYARTLAGIVLPDVFVDSIDGSAYNSLTLDSDSITYADVYSGQSHMVHASGEASFTDRYGSQSHVLPAARKIYFTYTFDTTKPLDSYIGFDRYERYSIADSFSENSLFLSKTSAYTNDYRENIKKTVSIPVTDSFLRSLSTEQPTQFPSSAGQPYSDTSLYSAIPDSFSFQIDEPFILESRNFYQYKTISLKFKPYTKIAFNAFPIVKSYDYSPYTCILNIVLKDYDEPHTGPVIAYTIQNGNGQYLYQKMLIIVNQFKYFNKIPILKSWHIV